MIEQLYSTVEKGAGSLPERLHFQCLERRPRTHRGVGRNRARRRDFDPVGRLFGWLVTAHCAATAGLYRVANWLAKAYQFLLRGKSSGPLFSAGP